MKTKLATLIVLLLTAPAFGEGFFDIVGDGPILERVGVQSNGDQYRVEVAFDVGEFLALFRNRPETSHMVFYSYYSGNSAGPDQISGLSAEDFNAQLLALASELPKQETHWEKYNGAYKTSAVVAAVGVAIALVLDKSGDGSGDDINISNASNISVGGRDSSASSVTTPDASVEASSETTAEQ